MSNEQRCQELAPKVAQIARSIAWNSGLEAAEVEQEMWVSILTHGARYPEDKNILTKAALDARQHLVRDNRPTRRAAKYLPQSLTLMSINEYAADDETSIVEECVGDANAPDVATTALQRVASDKGARQLVRRTVRGLDETRRAVAEMLMDGQRPAQIAERLEMTRPAVSYHIRQLRTALEPYRFLCAAM
jgi:DNA-directed RNA polymerase specialized sigma24 family protein